MIFQFAEFDEKDPLEQELMTCNSKLNYNHEELLKTFQKSVFGNNQQQQHNLMEESALLYRILTDAPKAVEVLMFKKVFSNVFVHS